MSYVRIGIEYGIVILILFLISLMAINHYCIEMGLWNLLVANIYFILLGVSENALYIIGINPFLACTVLGFKGFERHPNRKIPNDCDSNGLKNDKRIN